MTKTSSKLPAPKNPQGAKKGEAAASSPAAPPPSKSKPPGPDGRTSRLRGKAFPKVLPQDSAAPIETVSRTVTVDDRFRDRTQTQTRTVVISLPRVKFLERQP